MRFTSEVGGGFGVHLICGGISCGVYMTGEQSSESCAEDRFGGSFRKGQGFVRQEDRIMTSL
jgi:hypothetical protein